MTSTYIDIKQKLLDISKQESEPFKAYLKKGEINADKILQILRTSPIFEFTRVKVVGSLGIRSPRAKCDQQDFDVVVFVRNERPPFHSVLAEIKRLLVKEGGTENDFIFKPRTVNAVQFQMRDVTAPKDVYLSFSLLPAMNLLSLEEEGMLKHEKEEIQTARALQIIAEDSPGDPRMNALLYNSSFADRYVTFVENQSVFVQDVVRLAKLWNRKVTWEGNERMHGRSMMIELVAISVACLEEEDAKMDGRDASVFLAFQMFLNKFKAFDKNMLEVFKYPAIMKLHPKFETFAEETCAVGGPVILDPVNPFNNVATDMTGKIKWGFKFYASRTLKVIHNYIRWQGRIDEDIEDYFGI